MSKEIKEATVAKSQSVGLRVVFAAVLMGTSLLCDLYALAAMTDQLIIICGISLIFVLATFFFTHSLVELHNETMKRQEEVYTDLLRSSKASYLLMRKNFEDLQDILEEMDEKV